ncbi:hypothetical protein BDV98DRAFT_577854 [Pterulicium gracile]|uniref:Uncharacterized protein n=1 Tax=Pterulicium gracile TaxID=1884261 RepID=A0A5C3PZT5_9AGAR|nr:hypothetical protein BDV98DRAFT_577854 [Pterula gracilis]
MLPSSYSTSVDDYATHGPPVPAERLVPAVMDLMAEALNAADGPYHTLCIQSMWFTVRTVFDKGTTAGGYLPPPITHDIQTRFPKFMNALVNFVFRHQTVASLVQLERNFNSCKCPLQYSISRTMHREPPDLENLWKNLAGLAFGTITVVVSRTHASKL